MRVAPLSRRVLPPTHLTKPSGCLLFAEPKLELVLFGGQWVAFRVNASGEETLFIWLVLPIEHGRAACPKSRLNVQVEAQQAPGFMNRSAFLGTDHVDCLQD